MRRPILLAVAAAIALATVLVVATRGTNSNQLSATRKTTETTTTAAGLTTTQVGGASPSTAPGAALSPQPVKERAVPGLGGGPVPLDVSSSNTSGLQDGDAVAIHVVPKQGSVVYGFEAFLCNRGTYAQDADIRPTETGNCASKPLSSVSQKYLEVQASPPYKSADGSFRVGVGSDTYRAQDGRTITIVCGPRDPCSLVLKLQYPNGYGFEAIPLSFR